MQNSQRIQPSTIEVLSFEMMIVKYQICVVSLVQQIEKLDHELRNTHTGSCLVQLRSVADCNW